MTELFFLPELSLGAQAFLRAAYGVLLLATLAQALPHARRYFVTERWGGYTESGHYRDSLQNPWALPFVLGVWILAAVALIVGRMTVLAALVNVMLCRYFFVALRWKSILRGMGAPGFMTYWLGAAVFALEYAAHYDPAGWLRTAALVAFQVDFAVIMLCAGTYKALAGYPRNQGMEHGLINPWWGYWTRLYRRVPPDHWLFRTLNHLAYGTEIAAAVLMLFPPTRLFGAGLILVSFAFIATHIRLGFLCEMVMLSAILFVPAGHPVDAMIASLVPSEVTTAAGPVWLHAVLAAGLWAYVGLLPLAKLGQYYNLLRRRSLPGRLQAALDRYTNFFGIIIWRVFSVDHTNFFARIFFENRASGVRTPYGCRGPLDLSTRFRFSHVGEFICLVSLFTTLKYYPGNSRLFTERLLRYSRTLPCPADSIVVFQYISIRKESGGFRDLPVAEYVVDLAAQSVMERALEPAVSVRVPSDVSPVHEARRPGSYAPANSA